MKLPKVSPAQLVILLSCLTSQADTMPVNTTSPSASSSASNATEEQNPYALNDILPPILGIIIVIVALCLVIRYCESDSAGALFTPRRDNNVSGNTATDRPPAQSESSSLFSNVRLA